MGIEQSRLHYVKSMQIEFLELKSSLQKLKNTMNPKVYKCSMYIIQKALYNRDNIPVYYDYCLITLWKLKNRKSTPQDVNNSLLLQSLENLDPNLEDESFEC